MLPAVLPWLPPRNDVPLRNSADRLRPAGRPNGDDRPNVERWLRPREEEWLKTEPPSSDRPMLELLNLEVLRAELAGLVPPSREPPTTPSCRRDPNLTLAGPPEPLVAKAAPGPTCKPRKPVNEPA
ncbi:MAG TPA: hypothetical protein VHO07_27610, partial [Streptosporangiaceae bacterium]|nr:hypothetical protein [Streptosporangiaceae bacterium]